jgi:NhaP-type Na+/H+ or K+/H+ antiporter
MSLVARFELVLLLIAVSIVLKLVARRLRLPTAATLIVGGAMLALVPATPDIGLDPGLSLVLFLPPLLMASAYFTTWRDFRADLRIILQLAVGAVLFTTLAVGWVAHAVMPGLPWAACFALGAIVSPPDAVAAKAVLHGLPLPRRMVTLLEGESLVNDATGLVLYRFAVAAALTGAFSLGAATASFCLLVAGGVAVGAAAGLVASTLLGRLKDAELSAVASLLVAWGSYIGAERLGVSGVLSTVACGLVLGWRQHDLFTKEPASAAFTNASMLARRSIPHSWFRHSGSRRPLCRNPGLLPVLSAGIHADALGDDHDRNRDRRVRRRRRRSLRRLREAGITCVSD